MWLAKRETDVGQAQMSDAPGELVEIFLCDVLCDYTPISTEQSREAHRMVAAASTDVADAHAWLYCKEPRHLAGFIKGIALSLRGACWAHDLGNGAICRGKCARRFARAA